MWDYQFYQYPNSQKTYLPDSLYIKKQEWEYSCLGMIKIIQFLFENHAWIEENNFN